MLLSRLALPRLALSHSKVSLPLLLRGVTSHLPTLYRMVLFTLAFMLRVVVLVQLIVSMWPLWDTLLATLLPHGLILVHRVLTTPVATMFHVARNQSARLNFLRPLWA
eukprot:15126287-Heterocapsa_arctica.AAC.1